ncbi:hypothetical protein [Paenibacillus sp. NPDC058071]|uniref:hypothetical protein n=1 Tax=Paenibacillus sp. NPDC058071 TaxID=3346326 RepID=UPI0036DF9352
MCGGPIGATVASGCMPETIRDVRRLIGSTVAGGRRPETTCDVWDLISYREVNERELYRCCGNIGDKGSEDGLQYVMRIAMASSEA